MPSATSPAASPSRSSTVTAAPARESRRAQARPMPLAAPVTRVLRPVRSTSTDDFPGNIEASFMFLLRPEKFRYRRVLSRELDREISIGHSGWRANRRQSALSSQPPAQMQRLKEGMRRWAGGGLRLRGREDGDYRDR